ncbi:Crp/Fnr family transcriptional regulator [Halomonas sp. ISL-60]|uniref:Crp/Fnr family transcriptional regulator n=1 Tax=Halomonas sp. ISL-56 TaxID=2819149 RepID=UPI001BE5A87B|nr:Crp/Fnr family transcriptional regulator [Halomonas sp. ISL-56]MBT2773750.1 Crp/Fnr family transcriptional regulator [Halomonas sp. ISL-60]MBT2801779.1 Crp/Fnr family transcriptional regulator [Halomonas sp. ISL-56]
MTDYIIDIQNETSNIKDHCAQVSEVIVNLSQLTSLGDVLNRYCKIEAEALDRLSSIRFDNVDLKKNQKIHSLYQERADVFVVKKGWVSSSRSVKDRSEDICNVYMPGDIVGIRESFFDNHNMTVLALQNCQLDRVSTDRLHELFESYVDVKRAVISYIMVNDNIAIERLRSCTHHKAEKRVAHFLLEVYARHNFKEIMDSNAISLPIKQEVVGELLGITSVHVSRCMTALEQKKMIRKTRGSISLLQPDLLAEYADFDEDSIYGHLKQV